MRKEPQLLVAPIAPNLTSVRLRGQMTARLTLSLSHTAAYLHHFSAMKRKFIRSLSATEAPLLSTHPD